MKHRKSVLSATIVACLGFAVQAQAQQATTTAAAPAAQDATELDEVVVVVLDEVMVVVLVVVPVRGRPNASYLLPHTVRFLAALRGEPVEEVCAALAANATALFGNWGSHG